MTTQLSPELAADLSPAVRAALDAILDRFTSALDLIEKLTEALATLDRLDTLRGQEIAEVRLTVRLLCQAQGIETKGEPLVELVRAYTEPQADTAAAKPQWSAENVEHYQAAVRELRELRAKLGTHVIGEDEIVPDEHGNSYITFGDGTGAVHTAEGWFMVNESEHIPDGGEAA